MDKKCITCNSMFYAVRETAKYCSSACRVKQSRQSDIEQPKSDSKRLREMTQAEIEEHYTLKNYPPVKYYSLNGGGSGSYSPYPLSDKRSLPYIPR